MAADALTLDGISHRFGDSIAVDNVNLEIAGGELVALLGPSGCGKTTLLRIVAGFVQQTEGRVIVGDAVIDHLPPHRRTIGIVFQNYALFPHMSVADNIAYGLAARGIDKALQKSRVAEMLDLVQLGQMAERYPAQLSGGQQQRVALARALAVRPSILLLDEPFAALDKNLRLDMQIEIKRIQRMAGTTTIIVTHDQEEALSMADRVAVLSRGKLEQFAPATDVYDDPRTFFVNTFVGSANVLAGKLEPGGDHGGAAARVVLDDGSSIDGKLMGPVSVGGRVRVCIRPEHFLITDDPDALPGLVEMALPIGASIIHEVRLAGGGSVKIESARATGASAIAPGTAVRLKPVSRDATRIYAAT